MSLRYQLEYIGADAYIVKDMINQEEICFCEFFEEQTMEPKEKAEMICLALNTKEENNPHNK